ncbi:flagellin [Desulfosporosinus meridiei]|uniref:Flagellin n=1 Tax=Desulfosporosinus meridiei (strain ATCC BAA-275 / DSM 13257 / KCTC 12902 / NCIMB 13706 / S10) TaxID=768704 RepID=J7J057_DESMD|nr:flagellin/flagellar hook associated protein [Desulfosporosinus meridiei DSM 13257]
MIINHNMASLNTYRQMSTNTANTSKSLEKLSSGLRINKAGDDAAGLAISEKMRGQIRGLDQATRNSQDGISMIQTAEGALSETHSILQRMKELATQSANDTNTTSDRSEIQKEMNQLTSEINRIGNTTEFNTQKLLNGGTVDTKVNVTTVKAGAAKGEFEGGALVPAAAATAAGNAAVTIGGVAGFNISAGANNGVAGNISIQFTEGASAGAAFDAAGTTLTVTLDTADTTIVAGDIQTLIRAAVTNVPAGLDMNQFTVTGGANIDATSATVNETATLSGGADEILADTYSVPVSQLTGSTAAVAAKFSSGAITALGNDESAQVKFNGVTVTISTAAAGNEVAAAATDSRTASVTITNASDAEATANALKAAFEKAQGYGGSELAGLTFSVSGTGAAAKFEITDTKVDGATNNALKMDVTQITGTTFDLANDGLAATDATAITNGSVKGVTEVRGQYTVDIKNAFEAVGMNINIAGQTFTTVASGAKASAGQINVGTDEHAQALELAKAINANAALSARFDATVDDAGKITLTEKATKATGSNLTDGTVVGNKATAGIADFKVDNLVAVGGKYEVDGVKIAVTDDASDARIAQGTAVLYNADKATQTQNLQQAIAANSTLNAKYDSSASGNTITLTQKAGQESMVVAEAKTGTSAKDGFEAKFQVGANTAQSMTIEVNDMRAEALKISGTTASGTITASNGTVASLTATQEVTDGTNNTSVEYALDVSTHDKATAAISVLDDAIQSVSAERSKLGAYSNRLEHTITNLGTSSENLTAAESRIRDVDMAKEMMNFQKNNILSQAAQAMMAQANQQPQGVLQLLR